MDEDAEPPREERIRLPIDPDPIPMRVLFAREPETRLRVDETPRILFFAADDLTRARETTEDLPG